MLAAFVERVEQAVAAARSNRPLDDLKAMIRDAPKRQDFAESISRGFGLIAEIKVRSPSQGEMRAENVAGASEAYAAAEIVRAISVLTNGPDFGMSIERLLDVKSASTKPVLRKEFIIDPYQVVEARAFGADAILLMTQVHDADALQRLFDLAGEFDLEVLVECHAAADIEQCPHGTRIYGLNSRRMMSAAEDFDAAKTDRTRTAARRDFTTDPSIFDNIVHIPVESLKVAESGLRPDNLDHVVDLGFNAALVGTDLLLHPDGIDVALDEFAAALTGVQGQS